jgi:hypothetical protein
VAKSNSSDGKVDDTLRHRYRPFRFARRRERDPARGDRRRIAACPQPGRDGDAYFVEHYLEHLQGFDMIVQSTDETAAILDRLAAGTDVHAAIAPVRLGCVHERLHAAVRKG